MIHTMFSMSIPEILFLQDLKVAISLEKIRVISKFTQGILKQEDFS